MRAAMIRKRIRPDSVVYLGAVMEYLMAEVLLKPLLLPAWPLWPSPRLRPILTSCTDMDSDTMDMEPDTMEDTMADSDTTARGLLMLRPIPTFFMEDLDMDTLDTPDTSDTMAMDSDTCTARGLLMLRPIPTFFTEDTLDTPV